MSSAVTSGCGAVRAYFPEAPSGCPKRSEGGFPATARRKYTEHRLQNKHKTTEERHPSANQENENLNTKPLSRKAKGPSFVRDTGIEPAYPAGFPSARGK